MHKLKVSNSSNYTIYNDLLSRDSSLDSWSFNEKETKLMLSKQLGEPFQGITSMMPSLKVPMVIALVKYMVSMGLPIQVMSSFIKEINQKYQVVKNEETKAIESSLNNYLQPITLKIDSFLDNGVHPFSFNSKKQTTLNIICSFLDKELQVRKSGFLSKFLSSTKIDESSEILKIFLEAQAKHHYETTVFVSVMRSLKSAGNFVDGRSLLMDKLSPMVNTLGKNIPKTTNRRSIESFDASISGIISHYYREAVLGSSIQEPQIQLAYSGLVENLKEEKWLNEAC